MIINEYGVMIYGKNFLVTIAILMTILMPSLFHAEGTIETEEKLIMENLPPKREELPPLKLDSQNFTKMLNVSMFTLVYFSNPKTSGHNKFYQQFSQAHLLSHNVSFFNYKINFGIVDCIVDVELCKKNHIDSFPTMKMFNGTDYRSTYDRPITYYDMINFIYFSFTDEESSHRFDDFSYYNNTDLHDEL